MSTQQPPLGISYRPGRGTLIVAAGAQILLSPSLADSGQQLLRGLLSGQPARDLLNELCATDPEASVAAVLVTPSDTSFMLRGQARVVVGTGRGPLSELPELPTEPDQLTGWSGGKLLAIHGWRIALEPETDGQAQGASTELSDEFVSAGGTSPCSEAWFGDVPTFESLSEVDDDTILDPVPPVEPAAEPERPRRPKHAAEPEPATTFAAPVEPAVAPVADPELPSDQPNTNTGALAAVRMEPITSDVEDAAGTEPEQVAQDSVAEGAAAEDLAAEHTAAEPAAAEPVPVPTTEVDDDTILDPVPAAQPEPNAEFSTPSAAPAAIADAAPGSPTPGSSEQGSSEQGAPAELPALPPLPPLPATDAAHPELTTPQPFVPAAAQPPESPAARYVPEPEAEYVPGSAAAQIAAAQAAVSQAVVSPAPASPAPASPAPVPPAPASPAPVSPMPGQQGQIPQAQPPQTPAPQAQTPQAQAPQTPPPSFAPAAPQQPAPAPQHPAQQQAAPQQPAPQQPTQAPAPGTPADPSFIPRLISNHGHTVPLEHPQVIGRKPSVDRAPDPQAARLIVVPSPNDEISRSHCVVTYEHGSVLVWDLGSANGTRVLRGGSIPEQLSPMITVPIAHGDIIDLGDGATFWID